MTRPHPRTCEINTVAWLLELSRGGRLLTLGQVPDEEWDRIGAIGLDYVWLMGVWDRSIIGRDLFRARADMQPLYDAALPGWTEDDVIGSPYAIRGYQPDARVGGWKDLERARRELARRNIGLVLDFVPNHTGLDHPWVRKHPEYYVAGRKENASDEPSFFRAPGGQVLARGRDPNFPAWLDTAQIDVFAPAARAALIGELRAIAAVCDGVRCDMAMLLLNDVFARTWGWLAPERSAPPSEFWAEARAAVPDLVWIAEAYWDTEHRLQQLGFDFCYDKRLYDRLRQASAGDVRAHLGADIDYQRELVRFIENHDEPRAREAFGDRHEPAAVLAATLPGMRMWHHGELVGRRVHLPVALRRARPEPDDEHFTDFYSRLARASNDPCFHFGEWHRLPTEPLHDASSEQIIAHGWAHEGQRRLVVVNLEPGAAQGVVRLGDFLPSGGRYLLSDALDDATYLREGDELAQKGLHVLLRGHQSHVFTIERA